MLHYCTNLAGDSVSLSHLTLFARMRRNVTLMVQNTACFTILYNCVVKMHIISMNLNNCEDFWNYRFFLFILLKRCTFLKFYQSVFSLYLYTIMNIRCKLLKKKHSCKMLARMNLKQGFWTNKGVPIKND